MCIKKKEKPMATFAERLKELRNTRKITQADLAKLLGISKSTISMYERGERTPDFALLERICDYFNIDMDYLLGRDNRSTYYMDPEVARLAQEAYDDPDTRLLLDARKDLSKEDLGMVIDLVKRLKGTD
jgi:transcriptional regulator with XRE-family HTH domain